MVRVRKRDEPPPSLPLNRRRLSAALNPILPANSRIRPIAPYHIGFNPRSECHLVRPVVFLGALV